MSKNAKLRVCASCEFIFNNNIICPKCGFISYGARYVYGNDCYKFKKTQEPWINKKINEYVLKLYDKLREN